MAEIRHSVGRGGMNHPADVTLVQRLLNENLRLLTPLAPIPLSGKVDPLLLNAIESFQRRVVLMNRPDGRVDPGGRTFRALTAILRGADPAWIQIARREIGEREFRGIGNNNPRILEYIRTFPYLGEINWEETAARMGDVDETPWCACFVNWCLRQAGYPQGPSARAIDWLRYGAALSAPRLGAITVVYHRPDATTTGTTSSGNHVAFWLDGAGTRLTLLGGNQSDSVSEATTRGYWTILGYRWPE